MEESSKKRYIFNKNIQDALLFFALAVSLTAHSLVSHYNSPKIDWKMSPYLFPVLIAIFISAFSFTLFIEGIQQVNSKEKCKGKAPVKLKSVICTIAISILYYVIISLVTFVPATMLFLATMLLYLGEQRIWLITLISVFSSLAIYIIFGVLLHVMLP